MRRFTGPGYLALKIGFSIYLDEKSNFWPSVNRLLKE